MDSLREIEDLIQGYHNRLKATTSKFYRHIYHDIDWEVKANRLNKSKMSPIVSWQ